MVGLILTTDAVVAEVAKEQQGPTTLIVEAMDYWVIYSLRWMAVVASSCRSRYSLREVLIPANWPWGNYWS